MIKVYNRQEFATVFEEMKPGLGAPDSPLWLPEHSLKPDTCEYFICVGPVRPVWDDDDAGLFWDWNEENLQGHVRCFSSNSRDREEWWGFTDESDIMLWILKWAK